tara:strand:- start:3 stop:233 length:231 start_codon:yes stop_codon:yes gene_type:complete
MKVIIEMEDLNYRVKITMIDKSQKNTKIQCSTERIAKLVNNGYNSLLLMVLKRQTFYIFNLISLSENPNGFFATKS